MPRATKKNNRKETFKKFGKYSKRSARINAKNKENKVAKKMAVKKVKLLFLYIFQPFLMNPLSNFGNLHYNFHYK